MVSAMTRATPLTIGHTQRREEAAVRGNRNPTSAHSAISDTRVPVGRASTKAAPMALTADGRYVLAQEKPSNDASRVVVLDASTGGTVLAVIVAEGATVTQIGFRIGRGELVLGVVARDGGSRLVGSTLNGQCQSLTSTVRGSTSIDGYPYLLVRD